MKSMILVIEGVHETDSNNDEPLFWSNEDGWVCLDSAEMYSDWSEVESLNMPIGGRLMPMDKAIDKVRHFYIRKHNAQFDYWESLTDKQRENQISIQKHLTY